jgi:putative peptide zinc metalloprotease protein
MSNLKLRMRPELVLASHGSPGNHHWVVHDPVSLKFFRLRDEECSILRMLDGRATLDDIRQQFERQFAPLRLGVQQLHSFIFRLHEFGLVVADVAGQGDVLAKRSRAVRSNDLFAALGNPLAIRLPGLAARPIVEALYPACRWMFSPLAAVFWCLLVASAAGLVILEFGSFRERLPDFWTFFNVRTATWFAVALIVTKALHELGHALMCRRFGANCREFGVLLLLFMPTLFCDVSDAWRLPSRWQRILVSAAGMLVELVLASIATWLWWFSEPGLLNAICLRVMFLCSVSTIVFNANPLLRYDGYYILSDLLDVPNLWFESRSLWKRLAWNWLSDANIPPDPTIPRRMVPALLSYAALSVAYSWFVLAAILWFFWSIFEPQGLSPAFWIFAAMLLVGAALPPIRSTIQFFSRPVQRFRFRRGRAAGLAVAAIALIGVLFFVPLPHRISAPAWIEAEGAQAIYVSVPGRLIEALPPGSSVTSGQSIATLASPEIDLRVAELTSQVAQEQSRLKNLRLLLTDDPTAAPLIPAAEKTLEDAQERLVQWRRDQERLILRAPAAGSVLPPPALPPPRDDLRRLPGWRNTPLDPQNRGCYLDTGTLVCQVGDPKQLEAMLVVDQSAVSFVRPGQKVRLRIDQGPVKVLTGTLIELAKTDVGDFPDSLARLLDLPLKREGQSNFRAAQTYYQARVQLAPNTAPLSIAMHGQAKILVSPQPLGSRLLRWLQLTFRF